MAGTIKNYKIRDDGSGRIAFISRNMNRGGSTGDNVNVNVGASTIDQLNIT